MSAQIIFNENSSAPAAPSSGNITLYALNDGNFYVINPSATISPILTGGNLAGTANQIATAVASGNVTLSLPSTVIAPGSLTYTTAFYDTTNNAVTAAGTTQGTATALTSSYNNVTTGTANQVVILPTVTSAGQTVYVNNNTGNNITVYPQTGASINGAGANVGMTIIPGNINAFIAASTSAWTTTINYYQGTVNQINISGFGVATVSLAQPSVAITTASGIISTVETVLKTLSIGSNIAVGDQYVIEGFGTFSQTNTTSANTTFTVRCGTAGTTADTSIGTVSPATLGVVSTNVPFHFRILVTFRTIGSTGSALSNGFIASQGSGITSSGFVSGNTSPPTVNTTTNNILSVTYFTTNAQQSATFNTLTISKIR